MIVVHSNIGLPDCLSFAKDKPSHSLHRGWSVRSIHKVTPNATAVPTIPAKTDTFGDTGGGVTMPPPESTITNPLAAIIVINPMNAASSNSAAPMLRSAIAGDS